MALSAGDGRWDDDGVHDAPTLRPVVRVATSSGSITIIGEDRTDVVAEHAEVAPPGADGEVCVTARPSSSVKVRCPSGCDVVAGASSGSIRMEGALGNVRATTSSGRISVDHAAAADLRSSSGALSVARCDGAVRGATSSGKVEVGSCETLDARVGSGRVSVTAAGRATVKGVSSTVEVESHGGDVDVATVSGKVAVTVPAGTRPNVRVRSGKRPRIEVEEGDDLRIDVRTVSGRVTVRST